MTTLGKMKIIGFNLKICFISQAHRLKELEQKLIMAKKQLNKAALDKVSLYTFTIIALT